MNARLECSVDSSDSVSSKEEDALSNSLLLAGYLYVWLA